METIISSFDLSSISFSSFPTLISIIGPQNSGKKTIARNIIDNLSERYGKHILTRSLLISPIPDAAEYFGCELGIETKTEFDNNNIQSRFSDDELSIIILYNCFDDVRGRNDFATVLKRFGTNKIVVFIDLWYESSRIPKSHYYFIIKDCVNYQKDIYKSLINSRNIDGQTFEDFQLIYNIVTNNRSCMVITNDGIEGYQPMVFV